MSQGQVLWDNHQKRSKYGEDNGKKVRDGKIMQDMKEESIVD